MSLLTGFIVKNSHILAGIYFISQKKHPRPDFKGFQYHIGPPWKYWGSSYQVKQILGTLLQISCFNFRLKLCKQP